MHAKYIGDIVHDDLQVCDPEGRNDYLIVIRGYNNRLYGTEMPYNELYDIIDGPYRSIASEEELKKWNKVSRREITNRNYDNPRPRCITHMAVCYENMPCYVPVPDPLLNALSKLNLKRGNLFMKAMAALPQKSIYLNMNMYEIPSDIYSSYAEQFKTNFQTDFKLIDSNSNSTLALYDIVTQKDMKIRNLINWEALARNNATLSLPVLICTSQAECQLFSLSELYYDVFPKLANQLADKLCDKNSSSSLCNYSLTEYNRLHNKYTPPECTSKDSCKPIIYFINETGNIFGIYPVLPFIKGTISDFYDEVNYLNVSYNTIKEGFAYEILKKFNKENTYKTNFEDFSRYKGLSFFKTFARPVILALENRINNNTLFTDFEADLYANRHAPSTFLLSVEPAQYLPVSPATNIPAVTTTASIISIIGNEPASSRNIQKRAADMSASYELDSEKNKAEPIADGTNKGTNAHEYSLSAGFGGLFLMVACVAGVLFGLVAFDQKYFKTVNQNS